MASALARLKKIMSGCISNQSAWLGGDGGHGILAVGGDVAAQLLPDIHLVAQGTIRTGAVSSVQRA
jgi:hypothetical protein